MIRMSHLLRKPQEDDASLALLIALQKGQGSQAIAPRCTQEMAKAREEGISKREGLPLHQIYHLMILKSWMHLLSLLQKCIQSTSKKQLIMHGDGQGSWKSSKKEERILVFFPMMAHMAKRIRFWCLSNSLMRLLAASTLQSVLRLVMLLCTRQWWASLRTKVLLHVCGKSAVKRS